MALFKMIEIIVEHSGLTVAMRAKVNNSLIVTRRYKRFGFALRKIILAINKWEGINLYKKGNFCVKHEYS